MKKQFLSPVQLFTFIALAFLMNGCGEEEKSTSYLCGGSNFCWEITDESGTFKTLEECLAAGCQDPDNPTEVEVDSVCKLLSFSAPDYCYRKLRITHLDGDRIPNSRLQSGSLTFFNDQTWESAINPGSGTVRKSGKWRCKSDSLVVEVMDGSTKFGNFYYDNSKGYVLSTSIANYTFTFNAYAPFPDCPE